MFEIYGRRRVTFIVHLPNWLRKFAVWVASQNQFDADAIVFSARSFGAAFRGTVWGHHVSRSPR